MIEKAFAFFVFCAGAFIIFVMASSIRYEIRSNEILTLRIKLIEAQWESQMRDILEERE